ncbi:replication initiation factor domain-containing protein [Lysinibacillus capsici]|uniref:replication initiation factor domain-containing protein n=1 Tax=Lysinibacillus capsici TaxID=2115968 RepID=UPI0028A704CB|nr:replication initiation factor domain-containing protein [Lysinibacillus capsici]
MKTEENVSLPPYSNRGVENTVQDGLRACVDWLQVTFKNVSSSQDIIHLLGLDSEEFIEYETGKYGFTNHMRFGHIAIYYSYKEDTLYHLEITGQGCRELEQFGKHDWVTLLGLILMLDVNITRFDIAVDDFKGYFTFTRLINKIKKGHVRSRFRKARILEDVLLNDGSTAGTTIYFGSAKSDIQVRIYDKLGERVSKGHTIQEGIEVWNRTEIQMRDKRALQAVYELVQNIHNVGQEVQGILRNYVLFLDENKKDSNKGRWDISKFWLKFLNGVEPLSLTQVAPDATIEKVNRWFEHSVSANFALLYEAFDHDMAKIIQWLELGKERQKKKHKNMLNRFNAEKKNVQGTNILED